MSSTNATDRERWLPLKHIVQVISSCSVLGHMQNSTVPEFLGDIVIALVCDRVGSHDETTVLCEQQVQKR